jgi:catechol 2,3-dioxygenase-like lactoylglutathione lyase family enzyme
VTDGPRIAFTTVCLDCHDAHEMAAFYGALLGWEPTATEPGWVLMRDPAGGVGLSFQADPGYVVPVWPEEPGAQQKMMHLEIHVAPADSEALEAAVEKALAAGGRLAAYQGRVDLRVMLDPAGHPFCLFLD